MVTSSVRSKSWASCCAPFAEIGHIGFARSDQNWDGHAPQRIGIRIERVGRTYDLHTKLELEGAPLHPCDPAVEAPLGHRTASTHRPR
jgi:hypothetical protein